MKEQASYYSISLLCKVLQVSRSGYYAWLMRHAAIRPKMSRCFKVTTQSGHDKLCAENKLARQFKVSAPNTHWVSDISYVATQEGWLYLAVVIDLYSRAVVGWAMQPRMTQALVCQALNMACSRRAYKHGLVLHSDRGSQYASIEYQTLLQTLGIQCSMSRKGNCWDNAVAESFFHSLKTECIYQDTYQSRQYAKNSLFDYIEVFYNRQRLHSYLNYQSPWQFEKQAQAIC